MDAARNVFNAEVPTEELAELREQSSRIERLESELAKIGEMVQVRHPMGKVMHIGLMLVAEAVKECFEEDDRRRSTNPQGEELAAIPRSDLSRIASVLSELAAVVRIQNGNLHTDITEMLTRAGSVLSLLPKQ